jgi:hypothetical protein
VKKSSLYSRLRGSMHLQQRRKIPRPFIDQINHFSHQFRCFLSVSVYVRVSMLQINALNDISVLNKFILNNFANLILFMRIHSIHLLLMPSVVTQHTKISHKNQFSSKLQIDTNINYHPVSFIIKIRNQKAIILLFSNIN